LSQQLQPPQTTTIFNINNATNSALFAKSNEISTLVTTTSKESSLPICSTIEKIEETNDSKRINEEEKGDNSTNNNDNNNNDKNNNDKELVTIIEEKIGNSSNSLNQAADQAVDTNQIKAAEATGTNIYKNRKANRHTLNNKNLPIDSIYEPNSSSESLSPFQSNQNTVTSYADFIEKSKEENRDD
jgi:hypothetical protein